MSPRSRMQVNIRTVCEQIQTIRRNFETTEYTLEDYSLKRGKIVSNLFLMIEGGEVSFNNFSYPYFSCIFRIEGSGVHENGPMSPQQYFFF